MYVYVYPSIPHSKQLGQTSDFYGSRSEVIQLEEKHRGEEEKHRGGGNTRIMVLSMGRRKMK
jgi:hypothetical protein